MEVNEFLSSLAFFAGPSQLTLCSSETLRHRLKDRIPMPRSAKSQRLSHQCGTCWRPIIKMWVWEHRASSFRWHFSDENSFLLRWRVPGRQKKRTKLHFPTCLLMTSIHVLKAENFHLEEKMFPWDEFSYHLCSKLVWNCRGVMSEGNACWKGELNFDFVRKLFCSKMTNNLSKIVKFLIKINLIKTFFNQKIQIFPYLLKKLIRFLNKKVKKLKKIKIYANGFFDRFRIFANLDALISNQILVNPNLFFFSKCWQNLQFDCIFVCNQLQRRKFIPAMHMTWVCTEREKFSKSRKTFMCALRQRRRKEVLNQMKIVTEEFEKEKNYLMLKIKFSCHNSISLDGTLQEMKSFWLHPDFC